MLPDELIKYVESPDGLKDQSLNKLDQIISRYPYFQTARILYVKNLHNIYGKVDKADLNLTAAFVSDRKVLYYLLHSWQEAAKKTKDELVPEQVPKRPEREVKDTMNENISETLGKQQRFLYNEPGPEIELIPGMAIDVRKEYGKGIDLDDISFSLGNVRIMGEKADKILELEDEKSVSDKFKEAVKESERKETLEETKSAEVQPSDEPETGKETDKESGNEQNARSFSDWLNIVNADQTDTSALEHTTPTDKKIQAETNSHGIGNSEAESESMEGTSSDIAKDIVPEDTGEDQTPDSLVEKFIRENPRIVPKKEPVPLYDISVDSVKEHDSLFTDTLARIYIKQGNYTKAILVYEKLSLKYPEKSAYFAGQISEIKKLINK